MGGYFLGDTLDVYFQGWQYTVVTQVENKLFILASKHFSSLTQDVKCTKKKFDLWF